MEVPTEQILEALQRSKPGQIFSYCEMEQEGCSYNPHDRDLSAFYQMYPNYLGLDRKVSELKETYKYMYIFETRLCFSAEMDHYGHTDTFTLTLSPKCMKEYLRRYPKFKAYLSD